VRTILSLDEDVATLLNKEARKSGESFKQVVNRFLFGADGFEAAGAKTVHNQTLFKAGGLRFLPGSVRLSGRRSGMNRLIEEKRQEIERLCRRYGVCRIELFGSATGPGYDPVRSDLDFLVTFRELEFNQYADAYFGLLEDLQALLQRPVDLVVSSAIQNPYFRQSVESSRTLVYAD
jgi:hypothetical protein